VGASQAFDADAATTGVAVATAVDDVDTDVATDDEAADLTGEEEYLNLAFRIRRKSVASNEAPPTRKPSTSINGKQSYI
jgi:hypothetical protein